MACNLRQGLILDGEGGVEHLDFLGIFYKTSKLCVLFFQSLQLEIPLKNLRFGFFPLALLGQFKFFASESVLEKR